MIETTYSYLVSYTFHDKNSIFGVGRILKTSNKKLFKDLQSIMDFETELKEKGNFTSIAIHDFKLISVERRINLSIRA